MPKKGQKVNALIAKFRKKWGDDSVVTASEMSRDPVPRISTGNFSLDVATYGGIPRGRITRFWGREKSSKSGSCVNVAIEAQKHCAICYERHCDCSNRSPANILYLDLESKFDQGWAMAHGLDPDHFFLVTPDSGNQGVDMVHAAITDEDSGFILVIVDSIAHLTPFQELEKAAEDGETMGRGAKLVNSALRKWVAAIAGAPSGKKPTLLLINQLREKTGVMFGSPETMPMGLGQNFATSLDIKFRGTKYHYRKIKDDEVSYVTTQPKEDAVPAYHEINYRVTASSVCLKGRYGVYRYWLQSVDGRRVGDPDNAARVWEYARSYGLVVKPDQKKMAYVLSIPEGFDPTDPTEKPLLGPAKRAEIERQFHADEGIMDIVKTALLNHLMAG